MNFANITDPLPMSESLPNTGPMSEPSKFDKMRGLPWSIAYSTLTSIFGQLSFFGAMWVIFLNQVGLNKTQIGFLLSIIYLADVVAVFIAPTVARFGYKRTFIFFWLVRYIFLGIIFFTPYVLETYGVQAAFIQITMLVLGFCLFRSIGLTALFPWQHEYIPNDIRGKYTAIENLSTNFGNIFAIVLISLVLGASPEFNHFMALFAIGGIFGIVSVWMANHIPGGAPQKQQSRNKVAFGQRLLPLKDKQLSLYLIGASLIILTKEPINAFIPLYMTEKVGLDAGQSVFLQAGTMIGGLTSSFLWGWAADRYGSKPVILSGMLLFATLPVFWLLMPRATPLSLFIALVIAVIQGIALMGWTIGSTHLLFVNVVPAGERTAYMAVNNTWVGIISAASQFLGGFVLDLTKGLSGSIFGIPLDAYFVIFIAGIIFPISGALLIRRIREENALPTGEFAGLFLRGNPFLAMESLVRYQFARDERSMIDSTERLEHAKSPLTVEELLELLEDPRFNVRFEAIISIARSNPHPRLRQALTKILAGNQPALSVAAAWALGRMGDSRAKQALRAGLSSRYRSVQDHVARALGTLGDIEIAPQLLEKLNHERDIGLLTAYASALGKLKYPSAIPRMVELLAQNEDHDVRMELSLAIARILGEEHHFIRLYKQINADIHSAVQRELSWLAKHINDHVDIERCNEIIHICNEQWATQNPETGAASLIRMLRCICLEQNVGQGIQENDQNMYVFCACTEHIRKRALLRMEYIALAFHALYCMAGE